jgi:hypothetical protein
VNKSRKDDYIFLLERIVIRLNLKSNAEKKFSLEIIETESSYTILLKKDDTVLVSKEVSNCEPENREALIENANYLVVKDVMMKGIETFATLHEEAAKNASSINIQGTEYKLTTKG